MNTYTFEPEFIPGMAPGHLGTYLIPWGPSFEHDEARLNAVLDAHAGMDVNVKWDLSGDGAIVALYGAGAPYTPYRQFPHTDAGRVILDALMATSEAAEDRRVYTLEEIEATKERDQHTK
jgi:hypothetical protein